MSEEYLWDRSGEADPEVERLERSLASLAFAPRAEGPLLRPSPSRDLGDESTTSRRSGVLVVALLSAAAALLLVWAWPQRTDTNSDLLSVPVTAPTPQASSPDDPPPGTEPAGEPSEEPSGGLAATVRREVARAKAEEEAGKPEDPEDPEDLEEPEDPAAESASGSDPPVRERLSRADIERAFKRLRPRVKACRGPITGGKAGDRVQVDVVVSGPTGRVMSVRAFGSGLTTAVKRCVEHAVRETRFPRFTRARFRLRHSVRL